MAFEYVKDLGLKPARPYSKRQKTERILLHHTGGDGTPQAVHAYHISRGHAGADYNIFVLKDGTIVWGRGLDYKGGSVNNSNAKTRGYNDTSVAVAVIGDLERHAMPAAQKNALMKLVRDLAEFYGLKDKKLILGHDEAAGPGYTDCPGKYFPLEEVKAYAVGGSANEITPPSAEEVKPDSSSDIPKLTRNLKLSSPMMRGDDVKQAQKRLDKHLVDVGGIDGIFGPKTKAGVIRFQQARIKEGRDIGSADGIVGPKTWAILWE